MARQHLRGFDATQDHAGIWAPEAIDDVLLLALLPSLVVLWGGGTTLLRGQRWSLLGAAMAAGAVAYFGYARPGATRGEIETAAALANAHDFIGRLPKGYATLVGGRGVKLSGGERQRVALARAFLADAPILILDEATSRLDSESEALIQQPMEGLMTGRTALVIAHPLSTVRALDRILVFDEWRVIEDGRRDKLVRQTGSTYRRLFATQTGLVAI